MTATKMINAIVTTDGCKSCGTPSFTFQARILDNLSQGLYECTSSKTINGGGPCCQINAWVKQEVLNLTQHAATEDQLKAGVVDVDSASKAELTKLLTFTGLYTRDDISKRVKELLNWLADDYPEHKIVMVGSMPPAAIAVLERALEHKGYTVVYAVSDRVGVEVPDGNGGVKKTFTFKHLGFCVVGELENEF